MGFNAVNILNKFLPSKLVDSSGTDYDSTNRLPVDAKVTGSLMEQRGLSTNKPAPNEVEVGTSYWSVDTDPHGDAIEISDGTSWTVI